MITEKPKTQHWQHRHNIQLEMKKSLLPFLPSAPFVFPSLSITLWDSLLFTHIAAQEATWAQPSMTKMKINEREKEFETETQKYSKD